MTPRAMGADGAMDDAIRFLREMRQLRSEAGLGSAELAARVHYPQDVIVAAEAGPSLPNLPVLSAYVRGCGGKLPEWEERWRSLTGSSAASLGLPARPVGCSSLAAAGARAGSSASAVRIPDQRRITAAISRASGAPAAAQATPAQTRLALPAARASLPVASSSLGVAPVSRPVTPVSRPPHGSLPATRAEVTLAPAPAVARRPVSPTVPNAPSKVLAQARQVALVSSAPVVSAPAVITASPGADAASALTQPSRTLAMWPPASLARCRPSITHLAIAVTVATVMFAMGAIIMLLLRSG